jgi:hypothetical protein
MDAAMPRMDGFGACSRRMSAWGSPACFQRRRARDSRLARRPPPSPSCSAVWTRRRALEPGEICFTGNFQAVQGRKPFKAR